MELMTASRQWATRPADERFTSLTALHAHNMALRQRSASKLAPLNQLRAEHDGAGNVAILGPSGRATMPTHYAFGQLAREVSAPAAYLRQLPAPLAADCLNAGLKHADSKDVAVLVSNDEARTGAVSLRAINSASYGRVWNSEVSGALVNRFGDGLTGDFRVPGEFGKAVEVTRENTTLYAGDRDMFVFLADEANRITVPNRRNGESGTMARGFFVWNSEVGAGTLGIAAFLFDYVCCNRIVWGAQEYKEIRVRHTSRAPMRWLDEVTPVVRAYAASSTLPTVARIQAAQSHRIGHDEESVLAFLAERFTANQAAAMMAAHVTEEHRPIETVWDAVTGATAYARGIANQSDRINIEREAGSWLEAA